MRNASQWTNQTFKVKQYADSRIFTEEVSGAARAGFGIHQTDMGWHITHLKTGWAIFISSTKEGAQIIADYLIESYTADFERLKITGCIVEYFQPLAERIEADADLWNLRRLYVIPQPQLDRRARETQPPMQIIS